MMILGLLLISVAFLFTCWQSQYYRRTLHHTEEQLRQYTVQQQDKLNQLTLHQNSLETALHIISTTSFLGRFHKRLLHELATLLHHLPEPSGIDAPILVPLKTNELTYTLQRITTLLNNSSDQDLISLWDARTPRHIHIMIHLILEHAETQSEQSEPTAPLHPLAHCAPKTEPTHAST